MSFALLTPPCLFIARALNIFPLSALANSFRRGRKAPISLQMQMVMWFSGMRGALSFALVVTLSHPQRNEKSMLLHDGCAARPLERGRDGSRRVPPRVSPTAVAPAAFRHSAARRRYHQLVAATLMTVLITNLLMAPATRPLIKILRIGPGGADGADSKRASLIETLLEPAAGPSTLAMLAESPPPRWGSTPRSSALVGGGDDDDDDDEWAPAPAKPTSARGGGTSLYQRFRRFELEWVKPHFGGRGVPVAVLNA